MVLSIPIKEEVSLFNSTPHNLDFMKVERLPPIIYCQAERKVVTNKASIERFVSKFQAERVFVEGGHMFPLGKTELFFRDC